MDKILSTGGGDSRSRALAVEASPAYDAYRLKNLKMTCESILS
jgi:hypothetical protein